MRPSVFVLATLIAALCGPASAQSSASFKVTDHTLNAGGHPLDASPPVSASFKISHGTIGDAAGGFVVRYAPPGEVRGVQFLDKVNLAWSREPSAGTYNLYRNTLASLPGDFGSCYQSALAGPQFGETDAPAQGSGWLYLVTAENRLLEEGTKGNTSSGAVRSNPSACP